MSSNDNLLRDHILMAAEQMLGTNNTPDAFVRTSKNSELYRVPVISRINSILKKHVTDVETGSISSKSDNAKKCIREVAEALLEALYRVLKKNTDYNKEEARKYFNDYKKAGYDFAYSFKNYNPEEYTRLDSTVLELENEIVDAQARYKAAHKEQKKAERIRKAADKEIESKEQIKASFDVWANSPMTSVDDVSPTLMWLYYSITDISAHYPIGKEEEFIENWISELEDAGITSLENVKEISKDSWGFSIIIRINNKALKKLASEAKTNDTAKTVLNEITSVTTLKRVGLDTWKEKPVLQDDKLSGNYWVISLIKKLNELNELNYGYNFGIGENRNKDLKFSFIEDEEN